MKSEDKKAQDSLRALSIRLHKGWKKLHPVTESHLSIVRKAFLEEQKTKALKQSLRTGGTPKKMAKSKSKTFGHEH